MAQASPKLVNVLRSTLKGLEKSEELAADDPALTELKGSILSSITELEVAKAPDPPVAPKPAAPKRILWISRNATADVRASLQSEQHQAASGDQASAQPDPNPANPESAESDSVEANSVKLKARA